MNILPGHQIKIIKYLRVLNENKPISKKDFGIQNMIKNNASEETINKIGCYQCFSTFDKNELTIFAGKVAIKIII